MSRRATSQNIVGVPKTSFDLSKADIRELERAASKSLSVRIINFTDVPKSNIPEHRGCPKNTKLCANWVLGEVAANLNEAGIEIDAAPVAASALALLLTRLREGIISGKIAKDVFAAMWAGEGDADTIIDARGLKQISDTGALAAAIDAVLAEYPAQLADYRNGNEKLLQFFVGQVMKRTRGQANPQQLNEVLRQKLAGT